MWSLGYGGSYAVGSDGLSGGCVIFWVASMIVSVKAFNELCIDVQAKVVDGDPWRASQEERT